MLGCQWTREIQPVRSSDNAGHDLSAAATNSVRTKIWSIPIPVIVRQRARYVAPTRFRSPTTPIGKCSFIQRREPGHHFPPARPRRPPGMAVQPVESHLNVSARPISLGPTIEILIDQLPKPLLRLPQKPSQLRSKIRQRSVIASLPPNHRRPVDMQLRGQALLRVARSLARTSQRPPAAHTTHSTTPVALSRDHHIRVTTDSPRSVATMPHSHHGTPTFPLCAGQTRAGLVGPSTRRRVSTKPRLAILHTAADRAPRLSPASGAPTEFTGRRQRPAPRR